MYLNQELSLLGVLSWEYGSHIGEPALRVDGGEVFREEEELGGGGRLGSIQREAPAHLRRLGVQREELVKGCLESPSLVHEGLARLCSREPEEPAKESARKGT